MAPESDTWLTLEEFKSLKEISKGLQRRILPQEHRKRLIQLGLAHQESDGLVLTDAGSVTIAYWTSGRRSPPGA